MMFVEAMLLAHWGRVAVFGLGAIPQASVRIALWLPKAPGSRMGGG